MSYSLLVDTSNDHACLFLHLYLEVARSLVAHRMRVAQLENDATAFYLGAVPNSLDLQYPLELLGDSLHSVGQKSARQSMEGPIGFRVTGA